MTTRVVIALWALTREVNSLRWVVGFSFRSLEAIPKSSFLSELRSHPSEPGESGIPTRVRKTTVRTTPVRSQQCECQQCERVNSANANSANATAVRMSAVRMRQQCERRFSELCKTYRSLSFFLLQKLLLLFTSIFDLKLPITARISIYQEMWKLAYILSWAERHFTPRKQLKIA